MKEPSPTPQRSAWELMRDFFALSGGELFAKVAGFVAFAWLARTLAPESYGHVELAIQLSMMASLLVDFGLGPIGARELAADPGRARVLAASIPVLRLGLAPVAYAFVFAASGLLDLDDDARLLVRVTGLSLFAGPWVHNWLFQGLGRMLWVAVAQLIRTGSFAVLVLFFVQSPDDVLAVGVFEAVAAFAMSAWFVVAQLRTIGGLSLLTETSELRRLLSEAWPVGVSRMLWALYQYVPTVLVSQIVGGAEVAWFAAAHRLGTSLGSFVALYHFNLYPQWASAVGEGAAAVRRLADTSFRLTAWLGVWGGMTGVLLSVPLCQLVFGESYAASGPVFAIAIWTVPISLLSAHPRFALISAGEQRAELASNAAGAFVAIVGGAVAVTLAGAEGAAVSLVLGALATWLVAHVQCMRRLVTMPSLGPLVRPGILAAGIGAAVWQLFDPGWIQGLAAFGAFAVFAPLVDPALWRDARALALRGRVG